MEKAKKIVQDGYPAFLKEIKEKILSARLRAYRGLKGILPTVKELKKEIEEEING